MRRRPAGASRRRGVLRQRRLPRAGEIASLPGWTTSAVRAGHNGWREGDRAGRGDGRPRRRGGDRGAWRAPTTDRRPRSRPSSPLAVVAPSPWSVSGPRPRPLLSALAALSGLMISYPVTVAGVAALAVLFGVAGRQRPLRTACALVAAVRRLRGAAAVERPARRADSSPWSCWRSRRWRRRPGLALQLRDERRRHRATEQSAAASLMEYAARGERARIARELHDVVAHHITMIALQAEAARLATPGMPPEGARRLTAIGDTARTALTEMRRLLGVLREDVDVDDAESDLRPQPGLRQLNALLDEVRDAGPGRACA